MAAGQLSIRPLRTGEEAAANDGFNRAFGLDRSLEEWSWKFPPEPQGRLVMVAVDDEDRIQAHYAGVPATFQVDGQEWPAANIVDVYSAREARGRFCRRGVWVRSVERLLEEFGRGGSGSLLYGFPSPRPLRLGVLQLGYDAVEPQGIGYLRREAGAVRSAPLGRRLYRAELARDWEPRLDDLWRRVRGRYPAAVVRDARRAARRLAGHPSVVYHRFMVTPRLASSPVGFAAFRTDGGICRWVDLVWDEEHPGALDLLAHIGARLAREREAGFEEMWLTGDDEATQRLVAHGFVPGPEPQKLVFVARAFHPELDVTRLDGRVYLTMADADLV